MNDIGFWSVIPPIIMVLIALRFKQVYIALFVGIWSSWVIVNDWSILDGTIATIEGFVNVFQSVGNTRTIIFSVLIGSLLVFVQHSGGIAGFVKLINQWIEKLDQKKGRGSQTLVQLLALATGVLLFVETNISSLTIGTLYRPVFDDQRISREKLAYIADSSSAPSSVLIPFNAWGAFLMGLLLAQGVPQAFEVLLQSVLFNFYPMLALLILFLTIVLKKDIGPMKLAEERVRTTGKLLDDGAMPLMSDEVTSYPVKQGVTPKAFNMLVPVLSMVVLMPLTLIFTGWELVENTTTFSNHVIQAINVGSGSAAVLYSVIGALFIAATMYLAQGIMRPKELIDHGLKGMAELYPLALLMVFAFAIGDACSVMGTGTYIASWSKDWLNPQFLPAVIFVISSLVAFSTGTSWGTFAIMLALAVPMANSHGAHLPLVVAAAIGGGVFGDHSSPISDTSIIASVASATDHMDHVTTQMPYALIGGGITLVLYLVLGVVI